MERPSTVTHHPQGLPSQPPCRWQGTPPPSVFTQVNTALSMVQAVLASSCVPLIVALPALPRSTSLPLAPPPAWTALHVALVRAVVGPLAALAALLASMFQLGPAPLALPPSTSLSQLPPPAWTALLPTQPLVLAQPSWLTALPVLLASMLQLGPVPPALPRSTSQPQLPPLAWTALLANQIQHLARLIALTK
jgi:hypothetical protein